MPKRRTENMFPVKVYDSIRAANRTSYTLSKKDGKHIIPIQTEFTHGDKTWNKTMYINLRDLNANRQNILELMNLGMNKYHNKAHKKVIYNTRDELGNLERKVRGCIQIENKKKGKHQEIVDKYYTDNELEVLYNKKKIDELKSRLL